MIEVKVPLELSWVRDGQEWLSRLQALVPFGNYEVFGGAVDGLFDHIQCQASDPRLLSWLWVTRCEDGHFTCTIGYDADETVDDGERYADQITPWLDAILEAAALVGVLAAATWNAILGPRPQLRLGSVFGVDNRPIALAAEARVGPLRLIPGGVFMHEMPDADANQLREDRFPYSSWPLIVEGTTSSLSDYSDVPVAQQPMDKLPALRAAYRAAALLSLVWNECWVVRREPIRVAPGEPLTVPHLADSSSLGRTPWANGCELPPEHDVSQRQERELPQWLDAAWAVLDTDRELWGALNAYYEAMRLEVEHPSVAAMMYVTVIEGVGARHVELTPACSNCGMSKGATKRFRTALAKHGGMSRKDVDALTKAAYENRRSRTAHVGVLHGAESALGYLPDSDFTIDDAERFELEELAAIHRAARNVLTHALASVAAPSVPADVQRFQ